MLDMAHKFPAHVSQFQLVTFGSARLGNEEFCKYFASLISEQQCSHYVTSLPRSSACCDIVASLPPEFTGFKHVHGKRYYIKANPAYYGNVKPIRNTHPAPFNNFPATASVHFQQVYTDGVANEEIAAEPFIIKRPASQQQQEPIAAEEDLMTKAYNMFQEKMSQKNQ